MSTIQDFQNWLQSLVDEYTADYGTTLFFSNPYEAKAFVENNFSRNPRLSAIQIDVLYDSSENALDYALSQTNNPQLAALIYWEEMQKYIALNTSDPKINQVFETGVNAARDTYNLTYDEDVSLSVKLPWYVLAIPILFLALRMK